MHYCDDFLFKDMFGTEFSGVVPYVNGVWPNDFDVSLEVAKSVVVEPSSNQSNFGLLS